MKVDFYIFSATSDKQSIANDVVVEYKRANIETSDFTGVYSFQSCPSPRGGMNTSRDSNKSNDNPFATVEKTI